MQDEITNKDFDFDKFFAMSSLIFDDDYEIEFDEKERVEVKFRELVLDVPSITIDKKLKNQPKQKA